MYPLVNVYIAMEISTMLFMGKSTISTAIFKSFLLNYQEAIYEKAYMLVNFAAP